MNAKAVVKCTVPVTNASMTIKMQRLVGAWVGAVVTAAAAALVAVLGAPQISSRQRAAFGVVAVAYGMAIGVLSALFGLAHLHALPDGWTGVLLTGMFAAAMHYVCGKMRAGILVAIVVHFVADVVLLSLVTLERV